MSAEAGAEGIQVVYWNGFIGRAEAPMLVLEDAGIPYTMNREVNDYCLSRGEGAKNKGYPAFASPALVDGDFTVAQTTACCEYVGTLAKTTPADPKMAANVLQLACDAADLWAEGYGARKGTDKGKAFLDDGRCAKFMEKIEKSFAFHDGPYFFGANPTYADFAMLNTLRTMEFCYGDDFTAKQGDVITKFRATIEARPKIADYLKRAEPILYESISAAKRKE